MPKADWLIWFIKMEGWRIGTNCSHVKTDLDFFVSDLSCAKRILFFEISESLFKICLDLFHLFSVQNFVSMDLDWFFCDRMDIGSHSLFMSVSLMAPTKAFFNPLWVYTHMILLSYMYVPEVRFHQATHPTKIWKKKKYVIRIIR